jgi:hypothetical protein
MVKIGGYSKALSRGVKDVRFMSLVETRCSFSFKSPSGLWDGL